MKKLLLLAVIAACLYFAVGDIDWTRFWVTLQNFQWPYLLAALVLLGASYLVRAARWRFLFPAEVRRRGLRHVFPTMMIGYFANNVLPARGGEIARALLMGRHNRISRAGVLSTIVAERAFDGLLLSIIGVFALQHLPLQSLQWIRHVGFGFVAAFLAILILALQRTAVTRFLVWGSTKFPGHLPTVFAQKLQSMLDYPECVASARGLLRVTVLSVAVWLLEFGSYAAIGAAFGSLLQPFQLALFIVAVNFASLAPVTPGGIGAIELAATSALVFSGVDREAALAMVLTQHALQYLFCLVLGLYYSRRLAFSLRAIPAVFRPNAILDVEDLVVAQAHTYRNVVERFQTTAPRRDLDISMIIPAYNEEERLLPTLLSTLEYLQSTGVSHEIIVVDDGSQDRTAQLVQELGKRFSSVKLIRLPNNMGKGAAVRTGVHNATGLQIIFNDADGATPILEIERLRAAIEGGADVAIGSRALYSPDTHVERQWLRAVTGRIFAFLVNMWVVPGIADTQCGFKMFRGEAAHRIFENQQLNGFAFDVELLRIANVLGYRVVEVPVNWTNMRGSKVRLIRDSWRMFRDIVRVRYLVPRMLGAALQETAESGKEGVLEKKRL